MTPAGFPHSDISGSKLSRQLPEAFRSLTRPSSAPGAKASTISPCSLDCRCSRSLSSSQGARGRTPSKLNSVSARLTRHLDRSPRSGYWERGSAFAGRLASASTWCLPRIRTERFGSEGCQRLLRKEVIQPHLPVRLPCYDFTPIASPTFDGSLHKGWATGFGCYRLSWCDGRCVQGPGTYSPRRC